MTLLQPNHVSGSSAAQAAATLFAEYGEFIRTVIRFQAKNEFIEEDLYQEFFLALVAKPIPPSVVNIKGYLYRAVTNTVIESARQTARESRCLKKHAEETRISINKRTPQNAIMKKEERESVFRSLAGQLRHREAEAVMLRYRDNCSIHEISQKMGVDRRTVSRYLSAGLKQLRQVRSVD